MTAIHIRESEDQGIVMINIQDRFDFTTHKEFRAVYKERPRALKYVINMDNVRYIDSSALGMMLLLREHALKHGGSVTIMNCSDDIMKILTIANFQRLFVIQ